MSGVDVKQTAVEWLGTMRFTVGGEIRALPGLLRPEEGLVAMAIGARRLKGALLVATEQRLLFVSKSPLRPARCDELSYEHLRSVEAGSDWVPSSRAAKLTLSTINGITTWDVTPRDAAAKMADLVSQRIGSPPSSGRRDEGKSQA